MEIFVSVLSNADSDSESHHLNDLQAALSTHAAIIFGETFPPAHAAWTRRLIYCPAAGDEIFLS